MSTKEFSHLMSYDPCELPDPSRRLQSLLPSAIPNPLEGATLAKRGADVVIVGDSYAHADEIFEWLESLMSGAGK